MVLINGWDSSKNTHTDRGYQALPTTPLAATLESVLAIGYVVAKVFTVKQLYILNIGLLTT